MDKAKENAALVPIEVTRDGETLRIETKYPEGHGFWGGNSVNVSVDYKLWIPEKASLEVKSVSGDVKVAAIGGAARLGSVSGDVELGGAAGADVNLVSGNVTVENILGDAYLKTVSGDVKATKVKGSVEAESVSGDIELKDVSEAKTVTGKSVSGNITYDGNDPRRRQLRAHGAQRRRRPCASRRTRPSTSRPSTFSGTIDSDFQIQVMGKLSPKEVHGTVNGGGARIRAKSFSGSVEIKKY